MKGGDFNRIVLCPKRETVDLLQEAARFSEVREDLVTLTNIAVFEAIVVKAGYLPSYVVEIASHSSDLKVLRWSAWRIWLIIFSERVEYLSEKASD